MKILCLLLLLFLSICKTHGLETPKSFYLEQAPVMINMLFNYYKKETEQGADTIENMNLYLKERKPLRDIVDLLANLSSEQVTNNLDKGNFIVQEIENEFYIEIDKRRKILRIDDLKLNLSFRVRQNQKGLTLKEFKKATGQKYKFYDDRMDYSVELMTLNSNDLCSLLNIPGDFLLIDKDENLHHGGSHYNLTDIWAYASHLLDILTLNIPYQNFNHAEFIYEFGLSTDQLSTPKNRIEYGQEYNTLQGVGYFPSFPLDDKFAILTRTYPDNNHTVEPTYRSSYSTFRMTYKTKEEMLQTQEKALEVYEEYKNKDGIGFCADLVNTMYGDRIKSWWNVVPYLDDVIKNVYIPESIDTPDRLARSLDTKLICETKENNIVYPRIIQTKKILNDLAFLLKSQNKSILFHANNILIFLKNLKIIDENKNILRKVLIFAKESVGKVPSIYPDANADDQFLQTKIMDLGF